MPRTNLGLTKEQKERREIERVANEIVTHMNEKRGRDNMTKNELCELCGIKPNCLLNWTKGKACKANFETLYTAALRCGMKITVEVVGK